MSPWLPGASVWQEDLYEHLTSHAETEGEILSEYRRVAESSPAAALRYLASLILEDEVRHHELFRQLADALKADVEAQPEDPAIPRLGHWGDVTEVIEVTERLLAEERADAVRLRKLAHELGDMADTTLWGLLIELMQMDTSKHVKILEFVHRHAARERD